MEKTGVENDVHIGRKISEVLNEKKMLKAEFARLLGVSAPTVSYMLDRDTIDLKMLVKVSRVLKHNFLQYYDVGGPPAAPGTGGNKELEPLNAKIRELTAALEAKVGEMERMRVEMVMKE